MNFSILIGNINVIYLSFKFSPLGKLLKFVATVG